MDTHHLLQKINGYTVDKRQLLVCFLGQAGFLIRGNEQQFLVDPYLSNSVEETAFDHASLFSREFNPPIEPQDLRDIDCIFITHSHGDHCDPDTLRPILTNNPACQIIAPLETVQYLLDLDFNQKNLVACKPGKRGLWANLEYVGVPAAHYNLEIDANGYSTFLGYLITCNGVSLYHAGDTILFDGMTESIHSWVNTIDIGCIPVNGRDAERESLGIVGNLLPGEALHLADQLGIQLLLPMHNDLFAINSTDPNELNQIQEKNFPDLKVKWLDPGEIFLFEK